MNYAYFALLVSQSLSVLDENVFQEVDLDWRKMVALAERAFQLCLVQSSQLTT